MECRRGMLELDFLLERFLHTTYPTLSPAQKSTFARLLTHSDPQLLGWLTKVELPSDPELAELITLF